LKTLKDLKPDIANYYFAEPEEDEKLELAIQKYVNEKDTGTVINEILTNFPLDKNLGMDALYEAMSFSENPKRWDNFFIDEYERTFSAANKYKNGEDILHALHVIWGYEEYNSKQKHKVIDICTSYLNNEDFHIRRFAIKYTGNWLITIKKDQKFFSTIEVIKPKLNDTHRKVRNQARETLIELNALPKGYKQNFLDRILSMIRWK